MEEDTSTSPMTMPVTVFFSNIGTWVATLLDDSGR